MSDNIQCIFCKIIDGKAPGELIFQDEETVVFKDIKPAAKYHYLAVPKEHIIDVSKLNTPDHKVLLEKLVENGKQAVKNNGGDINDIRLGFHCPPFNSVKHLHLHVISPTANMGITSRLMFQPNTWWFKSVDRVLEELEKKLNKEDAK